MIKDELSHVISEDLDFPNLNSQPVVVFLNGEYWGVLSIRDRIDKYYLEYEEGADRDSINLVLGGLGLYPEEGSAHEMLDLRDWIELNGLIEDENLEYVETIMDVDNYIDYCIAQMFVANYDWPGNNVRLWSPTNGEGGGDGYSTTLMVVLETIKPTCLNIAWRMILRLFGLIALTQHLCSDTS